MLSISTRDRGDLAEALALEEQSLCLSREAPFDAGIARSLYNLGILTHERGDEEEARRQIEDAVVLLQQVGNRGLLANALRYLGEMAFQQGEHDQANTRYAESLALTRELGDTWGIAILMDRFGRLFLVKSEHGIARSYYTEYLALLRELGSKPGFASSAKGKQGFACCLRGFGALALAHEQPRRAVRFFAFSERLFEGCVALTGPSSRLGPRPSYDLARAQLGEEAFAVAWAEGRTMSLEEGIRYALEETETESSTS